MDELEYFSRQVAKARMSRRSFLGRATALGVTTAFANSLLNSAAMAEGPIKGGTLKVGMVGGETTNSLDPASWQSQVPYTFGRAWGEQLVVVSPTGGIDLRIAEEVGASNGALSWTFKIRKDVLFHNGKEVTPEDVVATLERHADKQSKSGALGLLGNIDTIKADGQNVVIALKEPDAELPYLMADYHLMIQPGGGREQPAAGIGTGPYKIIANEPGVRHAGEKFADYWAKDERGHADQIEILVINDATARVSALQSGQVHMINRVEPKLVELLKRIPGIEIRNISGKGHYTFAAHCDTAPFDNADLRLAIKYAVDREEMVEKILHGFGSVGNDTPINAAYPLYTPLEQRTYDPEKAAFHYRKSGHQGPILLRTSDVAFPGAVDAAQLYQQSAAKAGIVIDLKREPGDGYWSEVWNKQPFSSSYWAGRPTQVQQYYLAYYSRADWNDTRFKNEKFDQLLLAARSELDVEKRKVILASMGEIVHDEGGAIVPMFNDFIDATGPQLGGWSENPNAELMGGYALSQCWLTA